MPNPHAPFHPIIYVRGYAMTPSEIDETSADPFCGFNLGSTVYRAVPDKERQPRKYIFESPVVRLASDFGYRDVYQDGYDILDPEWIADSDNKLSPRSIIVFRYYDEASRLLGRGEVPPIELFSSKLGELILRVRDLVCGNPDNGIAPEDFRCYLVAHSMGGLVCRGLLQGKTPFKKKDHPRQYVDKFFTYATPHNGIEVAGLNVPSWLSLADMNNFNRERMADYLDLKDALAATKRVDWIREDRFPPERVFCMVGSNRVRLRSGDGCLPHLRRPRQRWLGAHRERYAQWPETRRQPRRALRQGLHLPLAFGLFRHRQQRGGLPEPGALLVRRCAGRHLDRHR